MSTFKALATPDTDPSTRSAALLLHALTIQDREWVLQKLGSSDRARLRPMLEELREMGIPADPAIVEHTLGAMPFLAGSGELSASVAGRGQARLSAAVADLIARLNPVDPVALAEVLRFEPPRAIAHVLLITDWPWRAAVMARLGPSVRSRVETALADLKQDLAGVQSATALRASLLRQVSARFDAFLGSEQWTLLQQGAQSRDAFGPSRRDNGAIALRRMLWPAWLRRLGARQ
ncbi:putative flagellar motor switch protein FliG [Ralstonia solanacearum CMR15]|nr:putative flagellar motor switch protein FliG [Ralstonia solanacearum CMR15]